MTATKRLSIIVASYNEPRIARALRSIRRFDDVDVVKAIIVDGGSKAEIKQVIASNLAPHDVFVSEPDRGIFDALNKGMDLCDTEFLGYLGADDLYTGRVPASQVLAALADCDLFAADVLFFRDEYVTRRTHAFPARLGLTNLGLHNPHYATFGSAALLRSERFDLALRGSDIDYFIRIFNRKPRFRTSGAIATLQAEGGFSNSSIRSILRTNRELLSVYARYTNWLQAPLAVFIKLAYKALSRGYYKLARTPVGAVSSSA